MVIEKKLKVMRNKGRRKIIQKWRGRKNNQKSSLRPKGLEEGSGGPALRAEYP